ncbi:MAG: HDOD domain-containing protein [Campylobacterales bacterium]|nr:HDOD domain-containing protein [Campylobacterales bacterium]
MTFQDIAQSVDSLPPLSDAILEIQNMYSQGSDNIEIPKLIKVIETDAMLVANILRMANAPMYGFSGRVSSISQAVTLFGIMQIRSFIMSYAVESNIKADMKVYGITNDRFNDMCNLQSALVLQWYSKISLSDTNVIAPLALIMESGKLVLAQEIKKSNYEYDFRIGLKECHDVSKYEHELVEITSYGISALLFKHWNLEPTYSMVLESTKTDDDRIRNYRNILNIVRTAINVRELLTKRSVMMACKKVKLVGLDVDWFVKSCIRVKNSYVKELKRKTLNERH